MGTEEGPLNGYARIDDRWLSMTVPARGGTVAFSEINDEGQPTQTVRRIDGFFTTRQPWYRAGAGVLFPGFRGFFRPVIDLEKASAQLEPEGGTTELASFQDAVERAISGPMVVGEAVGLGSSLHRLADRVATSLRALEGERDVHFADAENLRRLAVEATGDAIQHAISDAYQRS